jgi:hypothetical protein
MTPTKAVAKRVQAHPRHRMLSDFIFEFVVACGKMREERSGNGLDSQSSSIVGIQRRGILYYRELTRKKQTVCCHNPKRGQQKGKHHATCVMS